MKRRLLIGALLASCLASSVVVVLHAAGGPYNTNPPFCRDHSPANPLWWYYDCMYPDDPSWAEGQ